MLSRILRRSIVLVRPIITLKLVETVVASGSQRDGRKYCVPQGVRKMLKTLMKWMLKLSTKAAVVQLVKAAVLKLIESTKLRITMSTSSVAVSVTNATTRSRSVGSWTRIYARFWNTVRASWSLKPSKRKRSMMKPRVASRRGVSVQFKPTPKIAPRKGKSRTTIL